MFEPKSEIAGVYFLGELGGVTILIIKLILGVPILNLLIIFPNRHTYPFSIPPSLFF